ncbi:DUF2860 domain-containing protein [Vibrio sp. 1-1(7)]|nr:MULTISPECIES: DUF2860 domain-containing protein [Vibrio]NNN43648.1 DUF2860 domain-containing protein [Vibrio sp. 1-1(7)]NNN71472.1 DUF2860 domain-containing protein [Vibrio sp. 12-2(3-a)]
MCMKSSLIVLGLISSSAWAQLATIDGLTGELSLSTGFYSVESNLNTHDDNKKLDRLDTTNKAVSGGLLLPLGSMRYTFGQDLHQQIYAGTSREDIATGTLAFEVGYKYQFLSGMIIDLSILPTIMSGEVWEDPYQRQGERKSTDEDGNAFRVKVENIGGSKFSIDLAHATKDIENDVLGKKYQALRRDVDAFYFKTDYKYGLDNTTMIKPRVSFINAKAEGSANSFKEYGAELSYFKFLGRHQLALTAGISGRDYDTINPVFKTKRKDEDINLFIAYEYTNVMEWVNWSLISFAGIKKSDSNIDFYDQKEGILSVGLNYQW